MSYLERQNRKAREGKTPEQMRRAFPEIYGPSPRPRFAAEAVTYRIGDDGELVEIRRQVIETLLAPTGSAAAVARTITDGIMPV